MASEKIPKPRGRKPTLFYSPEQALDFTQKNIKIGVIFPAVQDYRGDIARLAHKEMCGTVPFYKEFPEGINAVMKLSGLEPAGIRQVASLPESECPDFVLDKIVSTVGREALMGYILDHADSEFIDDLRQQLNDM